LNIKNILHGKSLTRKIRNLKLKIRDKRIIIVCIHQAKPVPLFVNLFYMSVITEENDIFPCLKKPYRSNVVLNALSVVKKFYEICTLLTGLTSLPWCDVPIIICYPLNILKTEAKKIVPCTPARPGASYLN